MSTLNQLSHHNFRWNSIQWMFQRLAFGISFSYCLLFLTSSMSLYIDLKKIRSANRSECLCFWNYWISSRIWIVVFFSKINMSYKYHSSRIFNELTVPFFFHSLTTPGSAWLRPQIHWTESLKTCIVDVIFIENSWFNKKNSPSNYPSNSLR